ncbi:transcriptional repressor proteinral negative regulator of transcription subunit 4 [Pseudogymnoascus verrucosus]|uniref:Transcriptional repressor proteinral negative regulator of transcription subunit 4 n=1 Tax=Pseudogymnoascus verrucosus TaxID=342668 RepID=A0A1B8GVQ6_9PEZI|nr:transcriptional repressor general negative regulator of transcription subunit 4 [Pseudogymnoascus verrucosus]OBT99932.2 transcriptional repressor proteinral negative regulator of transcription subunit 4 [Pseudogymnoascus verrucosus]
MASSSRVQQDSFIDDDDLTCPLCVEEFDLSDRNFRPCPCGYQVCQFCFNNIKNNMNGLCPACRRPYDEKTIEWKVVTQEEIALFKANAQKNAKKKAEQRHKEAQKREVESLNRKHLAGLRVVQKNLVYVVGLSPGIPEQDLLKTLRGDKYFGQYGPIVKIVVSKAKQGEAPPNNGSLGVYVTFAKKEDAAKCIAAVNGSQNGDRVLRAQLGTTKYCSAYLRNEICTNKQCMFLHEPGDNDDSYSRQDLSTINSVNTQRPLPGPPTFSGPVAQAARQAAQAQAPIQQSQPVAAASQVMARDPSKDELDSGDGSALPSSASWAKGGQQLSRRGSLATSAAASSPAISASLPAPVHEEESPESPQDQIPQTQDIATAESPQQNLLPQAPSDPVLAQILKSINYLTTLSETPSESTDEDSQLWWPLFDDNGGLKRRLAREQQEEATRLHIEQELQEETRSAPEAQEEQEPGSGSGQLGGEPEDRDDGRESSQGQTFHDQRRPSAQQPIQRSSQDSGVFGGIGGQNFSPNIGNLATVNGRALTPIQQQQLLLLKSGQSGQPQSGFMEQYPPGIGALGSQQSTLFQQQGHNRQSSRYNFGGDSASAAKSITSSKLLGQQASMMGLQQGNQFYGSTVPGPPPGLKSTGTPPSGMFGQSQFGGAAFGAAGKDNNNDIIREMLRNRGGIGAGSGGQGHEAGKHDNLLSMDDDVSHSVDALVAESVSETGASPFHHGLSMPSRTSTPSVPPGFNLPHAHPSPTRDDAMAKPQTRIPAIPAPSQYTPPRSMTATHVPRVGTPLSTVSIPPTPTPVPAVVVPKPGASKTEAREQAKEDVKSLANDTGLTKAIASQSSQSMAPPGLHREDFPVLEKGKAKEVAIPSGPRAMTTGKKAVATPSNVAAVTPTPKAAAKKSTPGILNISVPAQPSTKEVADKEPPANAAVQSSAFPPLPPSTPATSSGSSVPKGPKSIRVVPTRTESPAISAAQPLSAISNYSATISGSRQASISSNSRFERPGTPASEIISDTASLTSASLSRPSSPPPTRVGSAPVRTTTKSQQKKQRREAMKGKEKTEIEAAVVETPEAEEIAPIMGRKKKQKKAKVNTKAGSPTPVPSRPPTPKQLEKTEPVKETKANGGPEASKKQKAPEVEATPRPVVESKAEVVEEAVQEPPAPTVETIDETSDRPVPTPSAVLQDLLSHGEVPQPDKLAVLRPPMGYNQRAGFQGDLPDLDHKLVITEEDRAALLSGRPVHKVVQGSHRIMLTPNGDCVRNLTPAEEERYLELQSRIFQESGPAAFVPARHNASNGFTLIGGRAVPNGPPAFFPPLDGSLTIPPLDPVSKIQRDEALSYINQYVLPSLSTNSQLERALNANALDTEMLRPNDTQSWPNWGTGNGQGGNNAASQENRSGQEGPYGANRQDGILASGLESMTAHFAVGRESSRGQPLGNVTLLSLSDSETAMQSAKKETEKLEKSLNQLLKKNRRLLLGAGH